MASEVRIMNGLSGELVCTVTATQKCRTQDVKLRIERQMDIPRQCQRLVAAGRSLRDDELMLSALRDASSRGLEALELALVRIDPKWAAVLLDIEDGWIELSDASEELKRSRELVTAVVAYRGADLQHASEEMRSDPGVVLAAVQSNGSALRFAPKELRSDPEIVLAAIRGSTLALHYAAEELWHDRMFTLAAVKIHGSALLYAIEEFKKDREVVLAAVCNDPSALRYAPEVLHHDPEIKRAAFRGIKAPSKAKRNPTASCSSQTLVAERSRASRRLRNRLGVVR
jgi:hypothetical protein